MAEVSVRINGYVYTVGCEDGQEAHLQAMAAEVDGRITSIKAVGAQSGEARLLMLASLLLADELHDMRLPGTGAVPQSANDTAAVARADRLAELAARAEAIADAMERS
ncbi:MAG: cell division protein ZapA [Acetobacteraceae bacterium]